MPLEPLRFIHAADLFLDAPLTAPAAPSPELRRILEDATPAAFDNVVQACLEREVDFLLLTGNTFVEADRSLRARVALISGLAMLAEAGIRTFVLPGEADPESAWQAIPGLPDGVTLFGDDDDEPVAVLREGRVIASVGRVVRTGEDSPASAGHFRIGLQLLHAPGREPFAWGPALSEDRAGPRPREAFDYVALGGESARTLLRTDATLTHHPGTTQGRSFDGCGPGGCALIAVDPGVPPQCTLLPTAAVRYERCPLHTAGAVTDDELLAAMSEQLAAAPPAECERLRCIEWQVDCDAGQSPLSDAAVRDRLTREAVARTFSQPLHVLVATRGPERRAESTGEELTTGFRRELQSIEVPPFHVELAGDGLAIRPTQWDDRLEALFGRLNAAEAAARAERAGRYRLDAAAQG